MQINRIKFFLAVVISETFSEAAEMLYSNQASVSKQVMSLEKELGVQLFDRSRRKAVLTPAGRIFLEYAKKLLDTYNEMTNSLEELTVVQGAQMTVASIPVMAHYGIIALISQFRQQSPEVNLIVEEREASDIIHGLEDGQYEMAFMRNRGLDHTKYQLLELYHDRLAVLLPIEHPLAAEKELSIGQLKDETFLMLGKQTGLYDLCFEVCRRYGEFVPKVGYTGAHMESIVDMISKNMGISLMMETPARFMLKSEICLVPIKENVESTVVLTRLRKRAPTAAGNMLWRFFRAWNADKHYEERENKTL